MKMILVSAKALDSAGSMVDILNFSYVGNDTVTEQDALQDGYSRAQRLRVPKGGKIEVETHNADNSFGRV